MDIDKAVAHLGDLEGGQSVGARASHQPSVQLFWARVSRGLQGTNPLQGQRAGAWGEMDSWASGSSEAIGGEFRQ